MPGSSLNLDLPTPSDNMATQLAKLKGAIEAIEADLAPRVPTGALNINTDFNIGGNALLNVGGIRIIGGDSDEVGTLFMDEELRVVTTAGTVQITSNGGLNIAALGTIGGDYGGVNPAAVVFDDLSGEFRFTESPGNYADLVSEDLILNGTLGKVRFSVGNAIAGTRTFEIAQLPSSGISGLVYDAAAGGVKDAAVTRESNTHLFTDIDISAQLKVTGSIDIAGTGDLTTTGNVTAGGLRHGLTTEYRGLDGLGGTGATQHIDFSGGVWGWVFGAGTFYTIAIADIPKGFRLASIRLDGHLTSNAIVTPALVRRNPSTGSTVTVSIGYSGNLFGADQLFVTPSTQQTAMDGNEFYILTLTLNAGVGGMLYGLRLSFDKTSH